jgi:3-oxoadipate enol-lactonase
MRIPAIFLLTAGRMLVAFCFGQLLLYAVILHVLTAFTSFSIGCFTEATRGEVVHHRWASSIDKQTLLLARRDERIGASSEMPKLSVLVGSGPEAMSSPAPMRAGVSEKEKKFALGLVHIDASPARQDELASRWLFVRLPGFELIGAIGLVAVFVKIPRKRSGGTGRQANDIEARKRGCYARSVFRRLNTRVAPFGLAAVFLGNAAVAADPGKPCVGKQAGGYVDVSGSKIYYEQCGSGPVIVLLHDGLLPSVSWDEVWQPLATKYHVIRYDRRGYGRSDPAATPFSPTQDLVKLLEHLDVHHALMAGSSSGGALAIDFAIAHLQMVDGLFLIGPVLHGREYSAEFRARANRNNEPMQRDDARGMARNWSQDRFLIAGANEKARRKIYEQLVANAEKLKKYDSSLEEKLSPPASERLSQIKAPTLILVGEDDIADVHAHCGAINAGIANSERVVVKEAGHLIQLDKPDEVVKRLENFADQCARKSEATRERPAPLTLRSRQCVHL